MSMWAEPVYESPLFVVVGPSVLLIIPFLIVFFSLRIRSALLNSIILFPICVLLEFIWWFVVLTLTHEPISPMGFILFLMPNILVIVMIIVYVEIIKVTAPIKTSSILASFCGFFHVFGIWFLVGLSLGGARHVIGLTFASSFVGIAGAVAYPNCELLISWCLLLDKRNIY